MQSEKGQSGAPTRALERGHWREGKATPQILKAPLRRSRRPRRFRRHHHHPLTADLGAARGRMLGARDGKEQKEEAPNRATEATNRAAGFCQRLCSARTSARGPHSGEPLCEGGARAPRKRPQASNWGLGTGERVEQKRRWQASRCDHRCRRSLRRTLLAPAAHPRSTRRATRSRCHRPLGIPGPILNFRVCGGGAGLQAGRSAEHRESRTATARGAQPQPPGRLPAVPLRRCL
jgi:hypothetical protein